MSRMHSNSSGSGQVPPTPPDASRLHSQVDTPLTPPNPTVKSTWANDIGSLNIPNSQNVNNPVAGGNNLNFYGKNSETTIIRRSPLQQVDTRLQVNQYPDGEKAQPTVPQQGDLITMTARADHEIYTSQLLTKKRGFPLWVPGPGKRLPVAYRLLGVNIGDVGIITSTGEFDFLFNIYQHAEHPINRGIVPGNFSPLSLEELSGDIQENTVYGPDTYLATSSVRRTSETAIGHRFESSAKEAAILVMPDGATTYNLLNTKELRSTISSNAKHWYTYAKETRGRVVKNGDIRVVVGVDKVSSWGIAISACNAGQTASYVFKHDPNHAYKWDCTDGSGRVGPLKRETHDLIVEDNAVLQNQCVFVRTINFTLSADTWNDFASEALQQPECKFGRRDSASNNQGTRRASSGSGSSSSSHQPPSMQDPSQSVKFDPVESGTNHPSAELHNRLHEMFPNAHMVITEDNDDVDPEDVCDRIQEAHESHNDWDIISVLRKDDTKLRASTTMNFAKAAPMMNVHGRSVTLESEKLTGQGANTRPEQNNESLGHARNSGPSSPSSSILLTSPISVINEKASQFKKSVEYVRTQKGPDHDPIWTIHCHINGVAKGVGVAKTKKVAKEEAARQAQVAMGW